MFAILTILLLLACLVLQWVNYRNTKKIEAQLRWAKNAILARSEREVRDAREVMLFKAKEPNSIFDAVKFEPIGDLPPCDVCGSPRVKGRLHLCAGKVRSSQEDPRG